MNLSTLTPTEIDTQLAEIYGRLSKAQARLTWLVSLNYAGERRGSEARIIESEEAVHQIALEAEPFEAEYSRRPWTRVFVVGGGHAHSTTSCHTCYPTTSFGWLPEWSGRDEAEIVDAAGDRACTVCYPTAPVNKPTQLYTQAERKDAAEREAEALRRAELAKAKAAKAISYRGGPLKGKYSTIATEVSAWRELVDNIFSVEAYGYSAQDEVNARIVEALSDKLGQAPEAVLETVKVKVAAKHKREGR